MIGRFLYGACAVALVSTTAVMAQPSGESGSDENKQICRSTADTGSRLGRSRECHTAREWAELRRQTQQTIDHVQNARAGSGQ
jgi:hypothetical protein